MHQESSPWTGNGGISRIWSHFNSESVGFQPVLGEIRTGAISGKEKLSVIQMWNLFA